jgi:uncharacterized repeat protein (TIGR01451 family)
MNRIQQSHTAPKRSLASLLLIGLIVATAAGMRMSATTQSAPSQTPDKPVVTLRLDASVRRADRVVRLTDAGRVSRGETINYQVVSENTGGRAAKNYRAAAPIPAGTLLVGGSPSSAGSTVSYSIDGGRAYSPQPMIEERQPDGTMKLVPAPLSMYTHLRFESAAPLPAGGKLVASYQVRVK